MSVAEPLPPTLATDRLELPLWSADVVGDLRAGRRRPEWHAEFPRTDDLDAATLWHEGDPWGPRSIVRDGVVVGSIGLFGPPQAVGDVLETEVGYGLVGPARGQGLATEALLGLCAALDASDGSDGSGVRLRASVAPDNRASIRVLAKAGFTELRGTDGEGQLVMVRPAAPAAGRIRAGSA